MCPHGLTDACSIHVREGSGLVRTVNGCVLDSCGLVFTYQQWPALGAQLQVLLCQLHLATHMHYMLYDLCPPSPWIPFFQIVHLRLVLRTR